MLGFRTYQSASVASAVALATAVAPAAYAQEARTIAFELPAQPLAGALREVAVRSGTDVIAASDIVAGRQAPALQGQYTAEEAVRLLLAGSGLHLRRVGTSLVVVAGPGPRADLGNDRFDAGPIVVTGTNLRGAEPTSKVIVVDRDAIDRSGATSVDQLMRTVPQNTQGGTNKENALVARPDSSSTDHGAGLNLRGLGQRATLVLVNGRRLAPSGTGAFVDVSLIPVTALERVEILTDGASAIYGSDAVGGVVNLILRDRYDGAETSLHAGTTTQGGGELVQVSQAFGHDWGSGHGLVSYEFRREDEVRVSQRSEPIGLRPGTFLLPRERRHSILGTFEQELAPGLALGFTGTMARRTTARTEVPVVSNLAIDVRARANAYTASGELDYAFAGGWHARLGGNYALAETTQRQDQPGNRTAPLANARDIRNWIADGSLKVDGSPFDLPGGAVRLAIGGEARRESYREGFRSSLLARSLKRGKRTVQSLYGEVLVPLFGPDNRRPGFERLSLSAAARYDHYSRTGSNVDPRLGVAWTPLPGLDLRGSYSTAFRAPLLAEAIGAYTVLLAPAPSFFVNPAQAPVGSIIAMLQGSNPAVQPESSRNWSIGGEWSPPQAPGLTLSLNYYKIRYSDRISIPSTRSTVVGDPAFASIFDLSPDPAAVAQLLAGAVQVLDFSGPNFTPGSAKAADVDVILDRRVNNTAVTRTSGLDIGLRHAFELDRNAIAIEANVTHIIRFDDQLTVTSPMIVALDRPYRPLDWRARGGVTWSLSEWSASTFVNYADPYLDDRRTTTIPVRGHTTVDLNLAYSVPREAASWLRGTRVALYVENLFDNHPPALTPDPPNTSGTGYDPINASARGRYVALQLRKSW